MNITNVISLFILISFFSVSNCREFASNSSFEVTYTWSSVNFTWTSPEQYQNATSTQSYNPINTPIAGIKYYKENIYLAMPRIRVGNPVTLGYISANGPQIDPLITPFPNWEMNDITDCNNLQNVQSMEIDRNGIMWVIDGLRSNGFSRCPTKLILFDLNNNSNIIHIHEFPEEICLTNGGFLNDIVVDENFAYITDASEIDPGLVVYSLEQEHAWKIRDVSMFAEFKATNFDVDGVVSNGLLGIDGIALSPPVSGEPQYVYYSALNGFSLYGISTTVLKNEALCRTGSWRTQVQRIGTKPAESDGMVADNLGNLFFGLLPLYGVGRWNTHEAFPKAVILEQNRDTMIWTDSFAFDDHGYLYLLANNINKYFNPNFNLSTIVGPKIRILRFYTGTNSYLYY